MICYSATHNASGKQYIGITTRDLAARKAEHETHSAQGGQTMFHTALLRYGKENFSWKVEAEGEDEVIKKLERMLIADRRTLVPRGFNSTNEAYGHYLPPTKDELSFYEDMDTRVAEIHMVYDLLDFLREATKNPRFTQETKDLIAALISHLEGKDCLEDR